VKERGRQLLAHEYELLKLRTKFTTVEQQLLKDADQAFQLRQEAQTQKEKYLITQAHQQLLQEQQTCLDQAHDRLQQM
jgi:hypothetical protein